MISQNLLQSHFRYSHFIFVCKVLGGIFSFGEIAEYSLFIIFKLDQAEEASPQPKIWYLWLYQKGNKNQVNQTDRKHAERGRKWVLGLQRWSLLIQTEVISHWECSAVGCSVILFRFALPFIDRIADVQRLILLIRLLANRLCMYS